MNTDSAEENTLSDELEPVSGVIVEAPITDADEARELMQAALQALKAGRDKIDEGTLLLDIAERRRAWVPLGYSSWQDCMAAGLSEAFNITLEQGARMQMVVAMRRQELTTAQMAEKVGTSRHTVMRDLQKARETGLLADEVEVVDTIKGERALRNDHLAGKPQSQAGLSKRVARTDLAKTWRNAVDDVCRRARTLAALREDDRYAARLEDLAYTEGDLQRAFDTLQEVLRDFQGLR